MQDFMLLKDHSVFKALAHPLRLQVLERLVEHEASVNQLASQMQEVHAKLFYHVKELEKHGLVVQVGEQVKNGITEKFYRATARTFFVGQSLGRYSDVEQAAEQAVEADILRKRRQHILQVDNRKVARELVRSALQIRPGERVILEGANYQRELMQAVLLECRLAGAEAFIRLMDSGMVLEMIDELTAEQLAEAPPLTTLLYGCTDLWVSFDAVPSQTTFSSVQPDKLKALVDGELKAYKLGPKRFAAIIVGYPTPEKAAELGMEYQALHDSFWQAMSVGVNQLQQIAAGWVRMLSTRKQVDARGQQGWRISFSSEDSCPPTVNDGTLNRNAVSPGNLTDLALPGGQIMVRPKHGAVDGTLIVPRLVSSLGTVSNLKLAIREGELVDWQAEQGGELFPLILDLYGQPTRVCCISFGFNPHLKRLTGYKHLDPVTEGVIGIGLGKHQPGDNSDVLLWLYADQAEIKPVEEDNNAT